MADLDSLDNAALQAKLDEITRINDFLTKENQIFTSYLQRHTAAEDDAAEDDAKRGRKGRGARKSKLTQLTIDQKLDVAAAEHDAAKKETLAMEEAATRMIDRLRAVLQQTDLRIADLKREAFEFKRDVVVGGEDPRTGKIMAERVVKYYEDQLRAKDAVVDKLRLKNQSLRATFVKAEAALRTKEEVGDVLHYIDFHQLQIENKQYLAKIEEKNAELTRLKLTTGRTVQTLNALKTRLSELLREAVRARAEIKARSAVLARLEADVAAVSENLVQSQAAGEGLARAVREAEDLPTIADYIGLKRSQQELAAELASWRRKVDILELAARQALGASSPLLSSSSASGGGAATSRVRGVAAGGSGGGATLGGSSAFGSGAPARAGVATAAAGSGSPRGHAALAFTHAGGPTPSVPPRGVAGFGGTLVRTKAGVAMAGTLQLGLPPAVRSRFSGGSL